MIEANYTCRYDPIFKNKVAEACRMVAPNLYIGNRWQTQVKIDKLSTDCIFSFKSI